VIGVVARRHPIGQPATSQAGGRVRRHVIVGDSGEAALSMTVRRSSESAIAAEALMNNAG
jgi:hypothetical protein